MGLLYGPTGTFSGPDSQTRQALLHSGRLVQPTVWKPSEPKATRLGTHGTQSFATVALFHRAMCPWSDPVAYNVATGPCSIDFCHCAIKTSPPYMLRPSVGLDMADTGCLPNSYFVLYVKRPKTEC